MSKRTIFKGIALTNFVVLVSAFLLYRNGSLDAYFRNDTAGNLTSPNGGASARSGKDSTKARPDSARYDWMSSSKSVVLRDQIRPRPDTGKPARDSQVNRIIRERVRMSSSKSFILSEPRLFSADTLYRKPKPTTPPPVKQRNK